MNDPTLSDDERRCLTALADNFGVTVDGNTPEKVAAAIQSLVRLGLAEFDQHSPSSAQVTEEGRRIVREHHLYPVRMRSMGHSSQMTREEIVAAAKTCGMTPEEWCRYNDKAESNARSRGR